MLERLAKSPLLLGAAFLLSALLGAGLYAGIQAAVPGANPDKAKIEAVVRAYILEHGEILPEAMDKLQARQLAERQKALGEAPKYIAAHKAQIVDPYAGATQGNPKGDVTVAAYLDYNCGYCRASLPAIAELVKRDPNVRIVYREYPVLAEESVTAARWALAAAEQGKFLAYHTAVYAGGRTDEASLEQAAAGAGVDLAKAKTAANSTRVSQEIKKNLDTAAALGTSGATPFWVVGNQVISGLVDYERLAAAVAAARAGK
ncbi:DsbA family protein [Sphingomonas sp.]|uniref:DsbA family protein n=1 Tax=Sphingomonas sp. TaxID=28214 RepID=UPI001B1E35FB|nr:DsbA family protein [Sphingomonas sp.]MBO9714401.1 thioredoxin domain-containing protein [Sphingomonas sp.]